MKQVVRKNLPEYKEYGGCWYIGETETHYLVTQTDREGYRNSQVYAVSKEEWEIKV